jgi:murein DD-endopeptidase MepM/ murein hydrolase activator NlpD
MKKRNFTLFFLLTTGNKIKKINLSKKNVVFFSIFATILLSFFLYMALDYVSLKHRSFENLMLRSENNRLNSQLEQFQLKMDKIEETLHRVNKIETKIRLNLQPSDPDRFHGLAMGPIPKEEFNNMNAGRVLANIFQGLSSPVDMEGKNASLSSIEQRLALLDNATGLQEQRLSDLQELMEDQKSLMRSVPALRPADGWVTSDFGPRINPFTGLKMFHEGIDIASSTGTVIIAPADGLVTFAGVKPGYGNTLVVDHGYGYMTKYAHNSVHFVKAGDRVKRGQRIATVGNTGRSTGPHVHYEVIRNGISRNPKEFILDR